MGSHRRRSTGTAPWRVAALGVLAGLAIALASVAPPPRVARAAPSSASPPMVFAPVTLNRTGPEPRALRRALRFYGQRDYHSATVYLHRVATAKSGVDPVHRERAEFFLGKALFHLRLYAASLAWFGRIVDRGAGHKYYGATLAWLAALQRKLPLSAGILPRIGTYPAAALRAPALAPIRDQLTFLLGRHRYRQGDPASLKAAVGLFRSVSAGSREFLKARFFEGVTQVRRGRPVAASRAFKAVLRATRRPGPRRSKAARREYAELARLALARVFYQAGQIALHQARRSRKAGQMRLYRAAEKMLRLSVKYYQSIGRRSPHWLEALFEESWALFSMDANLRRVFKRDYAGYQRSLGNIHTLNAPYFEDRFFPETHIVRAVTYFRNCRYRKAEEAVKEFQRIYQPLYTQVSRLRRAHRGDDTAFLRLARRIRRGVSSLPDPVARLTRSALGDRTFGRQLAFLSELDREIKAVDGASQEWRTTAVATAVLQDLTLQRSIEQERAGRLARARITRLRRELARFLVQANNILYEVNNVRLGRLTRLGQGLRDRVVVTLQPVTVDDEHVLWPFTGEYWRDELGAYRFVIRNRCTVVRR